MSPLAPAEYRKTAWTHRRDTRANQPAAADVLPGTLYYVTDEAVTERSDGATWQDVSDGGTGGSGGLYVPVTTGAEPLAFVSNGAGAVLLTPYTP